MCETSATGRPRGLPLFDPPAPQLWVAGCPKAKGSRLLPLRGPPLLNAGYFHEAAAITGGLPLDRRPCRRRAYAGLQREA